MNYTNLVRHAAMLIPAMTDYFSDPLDTLKLEVNKTGQKSFLTLQSPHGLALGATIGICITQMRVPNKIVKVEKLKDDPEYFKLTTEFAHDITISCAEEKIFLQGFANPLFNGSHVVFGNQNNEFHIQLSETTPIPTLISTEMLLENLEGELTGWHKVTAISPTELEFKTPKNITRNYTILAPKVVHNIRIFAEMSFDDARAAWVHGGADKEVDGSYIEASALFICPPSQTRMSLDRSAKTSGIAEIHPHTDFRATWMDGFDVFVFCPKNQNLSNVQIIDFVEGDLFRALNKTMFGLKIPRPELYADITEQNVAMLDNRALVMSNNAYALYLFRFECLAVIRNEDVLQAHEHPNFEQSGDSLQSYGSRALRSLGFDKIETTSSGLTPTIFPLV